MSRLTFKFMFLLWVGFSAGVATAQEIGGVYEGDGMVLTLVPDANEPSQYGGSIIIHGSEYPATGANTARGFKGNFEADGQKYPFSVSFDGESAKLVSDNTTYNLRRTKKLPGAPEKENPLAKKRKQQPDDPKDDDQPAPPKGGEGGVGIAFEIDDNGDYVVFDVLPGGPAARVGVEKGDVLVSVNGRRVKALTKSQVANLTRGPIGSDIKLVIRRDGNEQELSFQRGSLTPDAGQEDPDNGADNVVDENGDDQQDDRRDDRDRGGEISMVDHPTRKCKVGAPPQWRKTSDEMSLRFTDPASGVYVDYIYLKGVGFKSSKEFYERGWKAQNGKDVNITREDAFEIGGVEGFACMYESKDKKGILVFTMVTANGDGFIYEFAGPGDQLASHEELMMRLASMVQFANAPAREDDRSRADEPRDDQVDDQRPDGGVIRDEPDAVSDARPLQHPARAPQGWRVIESKNTDGRILAASGLPGRDAREVLVRALDALGRYFDARPEISAGFLDSESGQAHATFSTTLNKRIARGYLIGNPDGTAGVIYDSADRFGKSIQPLLQEMVAAVPELTNQSVEFVDARLLDNTGSMKIPKGWRITDSYQGSVTVEGPNGEIIVLGHNMRMMTGDDPMGIAPPMRGPLAAPLPSNIAEAIQGAAGVGNTLRKQAGLVGESELIRVHEETPIELAAGFKSAIVLAEMRGIVPGRDPIDICAYGLVGYAIIDAGTWIYYQSVFIAPKERFAASLPLFLKTWQTWKVDEKVLFDRIAKANESMRETTQIMIEVNHNRRRALEKNLGPFTQYIRDTAFVVDSRTGKVTEKPNSGTRDDPDNVGPDGQKKDPNQNLKDWIEDENKKAGNERFKVIDPNDAQLRG